MPRKIAAVIVPHPDDFEIFMGFGAIDLYTQGYQVVEILMTGGEYGVVNRFQNNPGADRVKGLPLQRIRARENRDAKAEFGKFPDGEPHVTSISMNYIDGHVPFSKRSVARLQQQLRELRPALLFSPDPVYSIDWHRDHMATAYNAFVAIRGLSPRERPAHQYLFQSSKSNFGRPITDPSWWGIKYRATIAHRSQMTPLGTKISEMLLRFVYYPLTRNRWMVRRIRVGEPLDHLRSGGDFIRYCLFDGMNTSDDATYHPPPQELGLSVDPVDPKSP